MVIATTGPAAFNPKGITLHSAANLPIGKYERKKLGEKKGKDWAQRQYLIVDEVSMMDCRMLVNLHKNLRDTKASQDTYFGGVNVIFMGDFLQIPTVSQLDVYVDKPSKWEQGHQLWRSLNAVVLLIDQMRQSDDPEFAAALRRIRIRKPTEEDIDMIMALVGVPLQCPTTIPIVVRRHKLRHALNTEKLREASQALNIPITHCLANIKTRLNMSLSEVYNVKGGTKTLKGDGILSVIPGAPLIITQNINSPLGMLNSSCLVFKTNLS
jgi:PIF1 helicase.